MRTLIALVSLSLLWSLSSRAAEPRDPTEGANASTARVEATPSSRGPLGTVVTLNDARFEPNQAQTGLWLPAVFTLRGLAGIYALEPIRADKTPILFVHGINGTPRDFSPLIDMLDHQRYQFWFLYYPSGYEISAASTRMLTQLKELQALHPFKTLHIVAHSMGGLVTRSFLKTCAEAHDCEFVRTFTSISTPFGGAYSAQLGVKHSPIVMPVWTSMNPKSKFLAELLDNPLPRGVTHHLVFGYRNTSLIPGLGSSDGTIAVESQLRWEAQQQASSLLGLDEDHMSILGSRRLADHLQFIFEGRSDPLRGH